MRTKQGQELHDSFVGAVVTLLWQRGFNPIYADLPTKAKPPVLNGYVPDVYAIKNQMSSLGFPMNTVHIVEVETEDTVNTAETNRQLSAFRQWATTNNATFDVVVAK